MTAAYDIARGVAYLREHAVDLDVARCAGVEVRGDRITYSYTRPNGSTYPRHRHLTGKFAGKTMQPSGETLSLYWPAGRSGGAALLCEGEVDAESARSAIHAADPVPAVLDGLTVAAVPGASMPADRAAEELRDAGVEVVYIAFDGDEPGRDGARRIAAELTEIGISAAIVELPDGADVSDEMAAAERPSARLTELLTQHSRPFAEPDEGEDHAEEEPDIEPLPPEEVTGLLDRALELIDRYVVLPGEFERSALALWIAHTHAVEAAHATPYLLVLSPEKRSGKTRLLEALELLVREPWRTLGASEAALFRRLAASKPTLLLDEIDAIWGSHSDRTEPIRAIVNAGNRPGASVARCVGEGKEIVVEDFEVFGAKILAGIDKGHLLPDTIRDRAIPISMLRKTAAEPVERFRYRVADDEAQPIRQGFAAWAAGPAADLLHEAEPDLPDELDDRAAEAWEPLFAIADLAGGEWPGKARRAALALSGEADGEEVTTGTLLLSAIRKAFGDTEKLATADLLAAINEDDELPFGGWRDGKGLDGRGLARMLKPYGVRPRTVELPDGRSLKGYAKEWFSEAWGRWLPTLRAEPSEASEASEDGSAVANEPHGQANLTDLTDLTDISPADGGGAPPDATPEEQAEIERIATRMGVET